MNKRWPIVFLFLALLVVAACLLWPSDESRIRKTLREGIKAFETRDLEGVMAKVSYAYQNEYGMSYMVIKGYLKRFFDEFSDASVEYEALKIHILKGEAVAELNLRVVATMGNERGYIIGDLKDPLHLKVFLRKEHAAWLITETKSPELGSRISQ